MDSSHEQFSIPLDQLRIELGEAALQLSEEQLIALARFVDEAGGIEEAQDMVAELLGRREAA